MEEIIVPVPINREGVERALAAIDPATAQEHRRAFQNLLGHMRQHDRDREDTYVVVVHADAIELRGEQTITFVEPDYIQNFVTEVDFMVYVLGRARSVSPLRYPFKGDFRQVSKYDLAYDRRLDMFGLVISTGKSMASLRTAVINAYLYIFRHRLLLYDGEMYTTSGLVSFRRIRKMLQDSPDILLDDMPPTSRWTPERSHASCKSWWMDRRAATDFTHAQHEYHFLRPFSTLPDPPRGIVVSDDAVAACIPFDTATLANMGGVVGHQKLVKLVIIGGAIGEEHR